MRQAAAEGAAHADRIMRDVAHDIGEKFAERIIDHRFVERRVAHAGADSERLPVAYDFIEPHYVVNVDKMCGLGEAKRHDRDEALAARQHAAVLRRDFAPESSAPRRASSARGG